MGRRIGQLTGLFALLLVILRLRRLLLSGPGLPRWQLIFVAAVLLGGVIYWLLRQALPGPRVAVALFALGGVLLLIRVAVPETLAYGIIPTSESWPAFLSQMSSAMNDIRHGVPPVDPEPGLLGLTAMLMWWLGGAFAWGLRGGPLLAMVLPPTVIYLQFAIFDSCPAGLGWMLASTIVIVLAVVSMALSRKDESGRARDAEGITKPRKSVVAAVSMASILGLVAVVSANNAAALVSEYGNIPWRSGSGGRGLGGGGILFDRSADLRQNLTELSEALLFEATLGEGSPPANQLYWRMETLDRFDGTSWQKASSRIRNYEPDSPIGDPSTAYQGTTESILQRVYIRQLRGELVPAAGVPIEVHEVSDALSPLSFRFYDDAALFSSSPLAAGDNYQVRTVFPIQDADLGLLATGEDGQLSPIFATAAERGDFDYQARLPENPVQPPANLNAYLQLPRSRPSTLRGIALLHTLGATTPFEQAWMLQHWFRDSGDFVYSLDVSTGSGSLDLADWLADTTSQNYRTGYCEQFAAAMGVLGRELGIPTRVVWGFTPGQSRVGDQLVVQVRGTNAHAWVEMWMDDAGWVQFDPTPRGEFQPESMTAALNPADYLPEDGEGGEVRPPQDPGNSINNPGDIEDPADLVPGGRQSLWWLIAIPGLIAIASVVPLVKRFRRRRRIKRLREGDITAAWDEMLDRLTDLGRPVSASLTPIEFARSADRALIPLAASYSAAVYGGRTGGASEGSLIEAEWWLHNSFDATQRLAGAYNPRSLIGRR